MSHYPGTVAFVVTHRQTHGQVLDYGPAHRWVQIHGALFGRVVIVVPWDHVQLTGVCYPA